MTRTEAAHINGALSNGPATAEGKQRSSQNALRHGMTSSRVVLPHEDEAAFHQLLDAWMRHCRPANPAEVDLVHEIAASRWRLNRFVEMESALFGRELTRAFEQNPELTPDRARTLAMAAMAESKDLALLHRYEARTRRAYERARKELDQLQYERQQMEQIEELPNEPDAPFTVQTSQVAVGQGAFKDTRLKAKIVGRYDTVVEAARSLDEQPARMPGTRFPGS